MTNTEKIRLVFLNNPQKGYTNTELSWKTGITPHQQVYKITQELVKSGLLVEKWRDNEKVFFLSTMPNSSVGKIDVRESNSNRELSNLEAEKVVTINPNNMASQNRDRKICDVGFEEEGEWFIEKGNLNYKLGRNGGRNKILYAFVAQGKVLYIGKSIKTLSERMNHYKRPGPSQLTNIRNHGLILELLNKNIPVQIYVLIQKEQMFHKEIPINLAAGLEDSLIEIFNPPWNISGKI